MGYFANGTEGELMEHDLKIWPQYFEAVRDGRKTFEVRNNDRGFQAGDTVKLRNWSPDHSCYIEPYAPLEFHIGYVLPIENDKVVFSLLPLKQVSDAQG